MERGRTWDRWAADPDCSWIDSSADWRRVADLVDDWRGGTYGWGDLTRAVLALHLLPHPLGCAYLQQPVPMPPDGTAFDARIMPSDWVGTWGEVVMAEVAGLLPAVEYRLLHEAAHPEPADCVPASPEANR